MNIMIFVISTWVIIVCLMGILLWMSNNYKKLAESLQIKHTKSVEQISKTFDALRKTVNKGVRIKTNIGYEYRIDTVSLLTRLEEA